MKQLKLNLGCGKKYREGYINVDIHRYPGVDLVIDFNEFPLPFKSNLFVEILLECSIHCSRDLKTLVEELIRISKNGAIIEVRTEHFLSPESANDPRTYSRIGWNTFNFFKKNIHIAERRWIFSENPYLLWLNFLPNLFPTFYSRFLYFYFPSNKLYFRLIVTR